MAQSSRVAATTSDRARGAQRVTVDIDNAPLAVALRTIARQAGLVAVFDLDILPPAARVTIHVRDIPVTEAFQETLRGTGLMANVHARGDVVIVPVGDARAATGVVVGVVTDAKTKRPLRGARVGLDGTERVTETGEDGSYRLPDVSAGAHTVTVKLLGYAQGSRTANVQDAGTIVLNIALDASAAPLDQVVVTGTVIPTELKAVPNAITVITAKQIEERGITKVDQLFHGDVPGLFAQNRGSSALLDEVTMYSRGATALSMSSAGVDPNAQNTNVIKTYIDGVELADPQYLSQIDPRSIERIEILSGPQASTIYGSNAINGVMQIFTKRGTTSAPQLTLNLLSGWVENNFSSARTPQHDYNAQLNGIEGRVSYNVGAAWNYMGPWTPAKQTARTSGFGGTRFELPTSLGRVTADVTFRRSVTQNQQRGSAGQIATNYTELGWYSQDINSSGISAPTTSTLNGQTMGVVLGYAPTAWWSNELGLGQDVSDTEQRITARGYKAEWDTTLSFSQDHADRHSLRYATTVRVPVTSFVQATVTAGADAWHSLTSSVSLNPQQLTGTLTSDSYDVNRQPGHNTGGFLQTQLGVRDQLFVTYGLRLEWNPAFGDAAQPNYAPRYGAAYTQDLGMLTMKLRASYGRSTRPPLPTLKVEKTAAQFYGAAWSFLSSRFEPGFGNPVLYLANPELGPEHQQGGEGGLEVYVGNRGSLVVTRYNQTVDGLITSVFGVDSMRSLSPCPSPTGRCWVVGQRSRDADGYGFLKQTQYLNLGTIRNQGWELQANLQFGRFTTRGTYSWTKSRVAGVTPKYRWYFTPSNFPQYQTGATFEHLAEHTWAWGLTYAKRSTTVGLDLNGIGSLTNTTNEFYDRNLNSSIRLPQNMLSVSDPQYISFNSGYALADLMASQRVSSAIEIVLQMQNVADRYINDAQNAYPTMGRQTKIGVRVHP